MREFIRHPTDIPIEYQIASVKAGHHERLNNICLLYTSRCV